MNVVSMMDDPVLFGLDIHPETNRRLQQAVAARGKNRALTERLLWEARAQDPCCLPVYFALYKFYSNSKRLSDAERAVRLALSEASRQGEFPLSWCELVEDPARYDLYADDVRLFYLFSLKALAFITLRQERLEDAVAILDALQRLDPEDKVGGSVIRALAQSLEPELEEAA